MDNLYEIAGFSRQAHRQYIQRRVKEEGMVNLVINSILSIRAMHNMMGLKKIYKLLSPDWIGRDRFIRIGVEYGLGIKRLRSYRRTTFSCKSRCFTNIAGEVDIKGINRVWVSDITYFRVGERFYYLTFIEDVYSRRIVGYVASRDLRAEGNCEALRRAIKARQGENLEGLIHHSDGGTQYTSNEYLKILSANKMSVSMCTSVYENTHIERVNGIIKGEYLQTQRIESYIDLTRELRKAVRMYNEERPHWSLELKTPIEYEEWLKGVPEEKREALKIYKDIKNGKWQENLFKNKNKEL